MRRALLPLVAAMVVLPVCGCGSENYNTLMKQSFRKLNELRTHLVAMKSDESVDGTEGTIQSKFTKELLALHQKLLESKFENAKLQKRTEDKYNRLLALNLTPGQFPAIYSGILERVNYEARRVRQFKGGPAVHEEVMKATLPYWKLTGNLPP